MQNEYSAHAQKFGSGQMSISFPEPAIALVSRDPWRRTKGSQTDSLADSGNENGQMSRFLVLTKRTAASGDNYKNVTKTTKPDAHAGLEAVGAWTELFCTYL